MWRRPGRRCVSNGDSASADLRRAKVLTRSEILSDRGCRTLDACLLVTATTQACLQLPIGQSLALDDDRISGTAPQ